MAGPHRSGSAPAEVISPGVAGYGQRPAPRGQRLCWSLGLLPIGLVAYRDGLFKLAGGLLQGLVGPSVMLLAGSLAHRTVASLPRFLTRSNAYPGVSSMTEFVRGV